MIIKKTSTDDFHRSNADWYNLLKPHAKKMRANPTEAEAALWHCLKGSNLGVAFKRQCVILDFIADFYSPELELIIEVDGEYHNDIEQIKLDEERTKRLEAKGYRIIRFTNNEVLSCTDYVITKIQQIIDKELYGR